MGNFQESISYFFSVNKLSFNDLDNDEKLLVIGSYISSYVTPWDTLEAINEDIYGEYFSYSMVNFFKGESDEKIMIENLKKTYLNYYSEIVEKKFDEECIELCNQEVESDYLIGMGYCNVK